MSEMRQALNFLYKYNKTIIFQWIPLDNKNDWNEKTESLVKKGTLEPQDNKPISLQSHKKYILGELINAFKSDQAAE